jgi:hypothetical protein
MERNYSGEAESRKLKVERKARRYAVARRVEDVHHGEHRGNLGNEGELKEYRGTLSGIVGAQW